MVPCLTVLNGIVALCAAGIYIQVELGTAFAAYLQDLQAGGDRLLRHPDGLGGALARQATVDQPAVGPGLLDGIEVLALERCHQSRHQRLAVEVSPNQHRHLLEPDLDGGGQPTVAVDQQQLVVLARPDEQRLQNAVPRHRSNELIQIVELVAWVKAVLDRELGGADAANLAARGLGVLGHCGPPSWGARPVRARPAGLRTLRVRAWPGGVGAAAA